MHRTYPFLTHTKKIVQRYILEKRKQTITKSLFHRKSVSPISHDTKLLTNHKTHWNSYRFWDQQTFTINWLDPRAYEENVNLLNRRNRRADTVVCCKCVWLYVSRCRRDGTERWHDRQVGLRFRPVPWVFVLDQWVFALDWSVGLRFRPQGLTSSVFVFGSSFSTHPFCRELLWINTSWELGLFWFWSI